MKKIRIKTEYLDNKYAIVTKINDRLINEGIQIELFEYDDNRVYRTEERARDVRLDCNPGRW